MCAISGYFDMSSSNLHNNIEIMVSGIRRAVDAQNHRGPDDRGFCGVSFIEQKSFSVMEASQLLNYENMDGIFGFNRLSIKDISDAGHQPMVTWDGKVIIVFNGEIYNDEELRDELILKGYSFKSTTDTEVILNSYIEYGFEKMIRMLNGMFAIAIADLRKGELYLARDRFGIKPLYYAFQNGRLIFASELKGIIQFGDFKKELDLDAVNARLVFSRPGDKVLLKNVYMLDPGNALIFRFMCKEAHSWKYFDVNKYERGSLAFDSMDDAVERAEEILSDAVTRQMVSDVRVGCQLSGGVDSTLVTHFANKMVSDNLKDSVSIVDEAGQIGEESFIDYVNTHLNLKSHKFIFPKDYFINNYEKMIWHYDAPVYKPFLSCFMRLAEESKKYVTVLLSGEGSDEIAGGYSRFGAGTLQPFITKIGDGCNVKKYENYAQYVVMTDTTSLELLTLDRENCDDLIQEQMEWYNNYSGSNLSRHLKFEVEHKLPESLMRQDKMTMAASIENRVPLLDNDVVDFIMSLPEEMLIRFASASPMGLSENPFDWFQGKYIFKEILARHYGKNFAFRRKETMDSAINERKLLNEPGFREYYYSLIYPGMKSRGLIDAQQVNDWYERINEISGLKFISMWRAIGLETWCQLFLDKDYTH